MHWNLIKNVPWPINPTQGARSWNLSIAHNQIGNLLGAALLKLWELVCYDQRHNAWALRRSMYLSFNKNSSSSITLTFSPQFILFIVICLTLTLKSILLNKKKRLWSLNNCKHWDIRFAKFKPCSTAMSHAHEGTQSVIENKSNGPVLQNHGNNFDY